MAWDENILVPDMAQLVEILNEAERSSGWQPSYSLESLKLVFNVSSEQCTPRLSTWRHFRFCEFPLGRQGLMHHLHTMASDADGPVKTGGDENVGVWGLVGGWGYQLVLPEYSDHSTRYLICPQIISDNGLLLVRHQVIVDAWAIKSHVKINQSRDRLTDQPDGRPINRSVNQPIKRIVWASHSASYII